MAAAGAAAVIALDSDSDSDDGRSGSAAAAASLPAPAPAPRPSPAAGENSETESVIALSSPPPPPAKRAKRPRPEVAPAPPLPPATAALVADLPLDGNWGAAWDLRPALQAALASERTRSPRTVSTLCDSRRLQHADQRDRWTCGLRNAQMLLAAVLLERGCVSGLAGVPSVRGFQRLIERAWSRGIDQGGAEHYGFMMEGRREWVGTTEVCSALRVLGLRAEVADFEGESAADRALAFAERYFSRGVAAALQPHDAAAQPTGDTEPRLPLYLQYQGHSMLVVGAQRRPGAAFLLVQDPSVPKDKLRAALEAGRGWQPLLKRSAAALKRRGALQMLCVDLRRDLLSEADVEEAKTIRGKKFC